MEIKKLKNSLFLPDDIWIYHVFKYLKNFDFLSIRVSSKQFLFLVNQYISQMISNANITNKMIIYKSIFCKEDDMNKYFKDRMVQDFLNLKLETRIKEFINNKEKELIFMVPCSDFIGRFVENKLKNLNITNNPDELIYYTYVKVHRFDCMGPICKCGSMFQYKINFRTTLI